MTRFTSPDGQRIKTDMRRVLLAGLLVLGSSSFARATEDKPLRRSR